MEQKVTTVSLAVKDDKYYADKALYQWNYGQILRIIDAELPMAVEVGFSTTEKSGDSDVRIGITDNGVTTVAIPDKLFKEERSTDYSIYAFVYVTDEDSGTTVHEIVIPVKARAKQVDPSEDPSIDPSIFKDAVNAVNASADRAETAETSAKESAESAEKSLSEIKEVSDSLSGHIEQAEELDGTLAGKIEQGEDIVANIKDKLDSPPNPLVGKYLRVKAVNDEGIPELEWVEAPSGGSDLDVRINGESIVKDGVADIPVATATRTGAVKLGQGVKYNGGLLTTDFANKPTIDSRNHYYAPIVPALLDYAVKAAMCDGKGAAWTSEEQTNARKRIGFSDYSATLLAEVEVSAGETANFVIEKSFLDILDDGYTSIVFEKQTSKNVSNGYTYYNDIVRLTSSGNVLRLMFQKKNDGTANVFVQAVTGNTSVCRFQPGVQIADQPDSGIELGTYPGYIAVTKEIMTRNIIISEKHSTNGPTDALRTYRMWGEKSYAF